VGAISFARSVGAFTVGLTCVPGSPITKAAELSIVPVVGPEVVTGSSRLKAGTAQKMVLNMISTATMVQLGYVTGNRMSHLKAGNTKLRERAVRIVMAETDLDQVAATQALEACRWDIREAIESTVD
jgi:N-acetylmuramic acid 6-phosphate etherase